MDERTLIALEGSIAKWEAIVDGSGKDEGTLNCPLCKEFYERDCAGCPVYAATGKEYCDGSPYERFDSNDPDIDIAKEELAFLRSLLPVAVVAAE